MRIILIIITIVVIWFVVSILRIYSSKNKIRKYNIANGGLKSYFPNFTRILENKYGMVFKYDDGMRFCYSIVKNTGELKIGLSQELDNTILIFSEFTKDGKTQKGKNVKLYYEKDDEFIIESINISIKNLSI